MGKHHEDHDRRMLIRPTYELFPTVDYGFENEPMADPPLTDMRR
jgi:hypothetical protein